MKSKIAAIAAFYGFLSVSLLASPGRAMAQAAPGPLPTPRSQGPATPTPPRPKRQEPQPRTTLAGAWKLNTDESDDPSRKLKDLKKNKRDDSNYPSGRTGGGVGFPFPGGGPGGPGGPGGGGQRGRGDDNSQADPKLMEIVQPASSLMIELKKDEVDLTVDQSRNLIFFTDGRQLQKPIDQSRVEVAAHWDGARLVSDEKSPDKGKFSREFELSQDGRQFYETLHIETGKSKTPVVIQYVYDIGEPPRQLTHETDPDQPIMKRHSDSNPPQNTDAQPAQPADPDQPVMKRKSDDDGASTTPPPAPQPQPDTTPDPDQPVMKRRTAQTEFVQVAPL